MGLGDRKRESGRGRELVVVDRATVLNQVGYSCSIVQACLVLLHISIVRLSLSANSDTLMKLFYSFFPLPPFPVTLLFYSKQDALILSFIAFTLSCIPKAFINANTILAFNDVD